MTSINLRGKGRTGRKKACPVGRSLKDGYLHTTMRPMGRRAVPLCTYMSSGQGLVYPRGRTVYVHVTPLLIT